MEISVLFDYTIWGKLVWHCWFEFNSTGLVDGVFHCSLLTCRAAEDTRALSRRFLHLSSLRERKSICQGDLLLEKKKAFVKLVSFWQQLWSKCNPYF